MTANKSRKELVRARMTATSKPYTAAARDVEIITEIMAEQDLDFAAAAAEYDDPRNELLCRACGWTAGMACPECAGCGCDRTCTGWRHRDFAHSHDSHDFDDDDADEELPCMECELFEDCIC